MNFLRAEMQKGVIDAIHSKGFQPVGPGTDEEIRRFFARKAANLQDVEETKGDSLLGLYSLEAAQALADSNPLMTSVDNQNTVKEVTTSNRTFCELLRRILISGHNIPLKRLSGTDDDYKRWGDLYEMLISENSTPTRRAACEDWLDTIIPILVNAAASKLVKPSPRCTCSTASEDLCEWCRSIGLPWKPVPLIKRISPL
ncbi:hypothetical protein C8J56DRAFT_981885 [Mycena floridula]|nr:hypothetical protein C8J56DRAFT_981885 [Mycena floridula]